MLNKIRTVNLGVLLVSLAACGGSGGNSQSASDDPSDRPSDGGILDTSIADPFERFEWPIDESSYIRLASTVYQGVRTTFTGFSVVGRLRLFLIDLSAEGTKTEVCTYGGTKTETITKESNNALSIGDSLKDDYQLCDNSNSYEVSGSYNFSLEDLEGVYSSDNEFVLRYRMRGNETRTNDEREGANGVYEYDLNYTESYIPGITGGISLAGINLNEIYSGVAPSEIDNIFADVIAYDIANPPNWDSFQNDPFTELDSIAFELIYDNTQPYDVFSFQWRINAEYLKDSRGSFVFETITPLVLEERERIDPEDNSLEFYDYALEGQVLLTMNTGQKINILVGEPSPISVGPDDTENANVTVAFDSDGDGTFEASETMRWEDFSQAFLDYRL